MMATEGGFIFTLQASGEKMLVLCRCGHPRWQHEAWASGSPAFCRNVDNVTFYGAAKDPVRCSCGVFVEAV